MRRSDTLMKVLSVILLIAIICYMGFHLADSLINPLQTTLAVNSRVTSSAHAEGYVVRQEQTLTSAGIVSPVENGKKIAAGGVVAVSYAREEALAVADRMLEIDARIAHLETIIAGSAENSAADSLTDLSSAVNHRELSDLESILYKAEYTFFGTADEENDPSAELSALKEERESLEAYSSGYSYVTARKSGIFAVSTDGFEDISYDSIDGLTPGALQNLFTTPHKSDKAFGKLIIDDTWYFAAIMSAEDVKNLTVGDTATIEFTKNYTNDLTMTVAAISPKSDGKNVVIFSCSTAMADICNVRELSGDVIFSSQTGILTPKEAVYTDEEGVTFVYLLMGLQAQRVDIDIVCDYNENYYLIAPAEGEILNEGAEIIIRGKNLFDGKVVK